MDPLHHDPRRPNHSVEIRVTGLNCTNCALSLERHLSRVGAHSPTVDFASGRTTFSVGDLSKLPEIKKSIQRLGYSVFEISEPANHSRSTLLYAKTLVSALLTLPMLLGMFVHIPLLHNPLVQLVLATPVFLIGITHFGASGIRSIKAGVANMDVLITAGILAGYSASLLTLLFNLGSDLIFFEAVASIVTFILVGHLLEERAVQRTTSAIEELSGLHAQDAKRISLSPTGQDIIEVVRISDLQGGDLLQVNTGDRVPTDGVIARGSASIDESMLTGEATPVDRTVGEKVTGGTIAISGSITVRATAIGDDTELASIIRLVQDAQQRKPSIQRIGDAVSAWFVPCVLLAAIATFVAGVAFFGISLSEAIVRSLAIVVVACPCAMGLATPTAIMVALGRAAHSGILIRGGDTLERLAKINHVAFDKTGTLTEGNLTIGAFETHNGFEKVQAQSIMLALQRASSHPISRSITKAFQEQELPAVVMHTVLEMKGLGVEGHDDKGAHYVCGGRAVASRFAISTSDDIILVKDGTLIASLTLNDTVRAEAPEVVTKLIESGISTSLISGDTARKCSDVASHVGITSVYSEQLPEQKLTVLRGIQKHQQVAYLGDGINDAPTLAEATVGISLGSASDVAMKSAQVLLTGDSLAALPKALTLGKITVRTIKQNLFWAFFYNLAAIPLAAMGFISPLTGALLMTISDVVIVGNSLRIRYRSL